MTRELIISERRIADDEPPFVIAEIGHNHQGNIETCKALFTAAARAGCDAVKLQKRDNKTLFTQEMYDAPYASENAFGSTYGLHREALEFGWEEYIELKRFAESLGLVFFATAFDIPSADFLAGLDVPVFKIASACLTDLPLIEHVASFGKPMIISTGGATWDDLLRVWIALKGAQYAFLQCTATYPCEPEEMNLRVISEMSKYYPVVWGLSDHQDGIDMAPVAYALGARIFEKHFTLSHTWKGSDHAFSLEPDGMARMVRSLRRVEVALGDGVKRRYESEQPALYKMGKSLRAARSLPAGHALIEQDIAIKSPGEGLPPYRYPEVLGKITARFFKQDEALDEVLA